jgi:hypothetical protein
VNTQLQLKDNVMSFPNMTPPVATQNDNEERTPIKYYVVNSMVEFIYAAIKQGRLNDFVIAHKGQMVANFTEFLEISNHGEFDNWINTHLIVDQGYDITIMKLVNNVGVIQ